MSENAHSFLFWLALFILAIPQLIVIIGWITYAMLSYSPMIKPVWYNTTDLTGVDVVIPVRGSEYSLENLLLSFRPARTMGAHIVLLESTTERPISLSEVEAQQRQFVENPDWLMCKTAWGTHCWGPPPQGYKSGVLNLWLQNSNSPIVVVFDADWLVDNAHLACLVQALREHPDAAFSQGRWEFQNDGTSWIARADAASLRLHHDVEQQIRATQKVPFGLNGSFMALRREIIMQCEGFDANQLSEDVDLGFRFARSGYHGLYIACAEARGLVTTRLSAYRTQKVRWAAGRFQALLRHGPTLSTGSNWLSGLLNLHYLLEYATPLSAVLLAFISLTPLAPPLLPSVTVLLVLTPSLLRAHMTLRHGDANRRVHQKLSATVGDLVLRFLFSGTCLVVGLGVILGWSPGWRWDTGRLVMIGCSLLLIAFSVIALDYVTSLSALANWAILAGISGSGLMLWGWRSVNHE